MKYGFFVHYVWGGTAYRATINSDGTTPAGLDDLADRFDARGMADDLASMRVEYVIFTAWHANMNCLWPSEKMSQWLPGHASKRDVVRDTINAVKAKGIRIILYTHPRDGHDLTPAEQAATGWGPLFDHAKWNNFINDIYGDLISRYGNDIEGLYIDEGRKNSDYVDYVRLRNTIKAGNPNLVMLQNYFGDIYNCDFAHQEFHPGSPDENTWRANRLPVGVPVGGFWWAVAPVEKYAARHSADAIFRYTILKAGISRSAGGIAWAAGNFPGGGWETGVLETMQAVARHLAPIARSITNTYASTSYTTGESSTLKSLQWGVATRSTDDRYEYIHVLKPPLGKTLTLPPPADHKLFSSARLVANGQPVGLIQDKSGVVLTLMGPNGWGSLDTVIELTVSGATPFSDSTFCDDFSKSLHRWQNTGGNWTNIAGEYTQSDIGGVGLAAVTSDKWADATYEFDFRILNYGSNSANWAGCNLRTVFPSDTFSVSGYLIYFRANGQVCLHNPSGDLATAPSGLGFTNLTHVKITTCGPNIKIHLNHSNNPIIDFNGLTNTAPGYFSLATCGTHSHFDNVAIAPSSGFETPVITSFQAQPTGGIWTFHGSSGVTTNNDSTLSAGSPGPEGQQSAFLRSGGSCSTTLSFAPGKYRLIFSAARLETALPAGQNFDVLLDGRRIGRYAFPTFPTNFQEQATAPFEVAEGKHVLKFIVGKTKGQTNTLLLDNIRLEFKR